MERCHNHSHSKTKQRPKHWHKLPTLSFLSCIAKTLEKTLLPYIIKKQQNILIISHQHGFKLKHSTHTALHNNCHQITKDFINPRPPQCTVAVALNMSKALDAVNIHKLIHKLTLTNTPNIIIIKFIANYIKGQQACTQYNGTLSKLKTNQHWSTTRWSFISDIIQHLHF